MKLAGQTVAVILTDEGKAVLTLARVELAESDLHILSIEESEDLGLWIRVTRGQNLSFFLLRWEYILGINLPGSGRVVGWKG